MMTCPTNNTSFKYIVLSDVHLGHPRNKTDNIIKNLDSFFGNFTKYRDLDAIFIAGDLFDTLLDNHTPDYHNIIIWVYRLMHFCARNNIKLRILEGTPSHDWNQPRIFQTLIGVSTLPLDFKYVSNIFIEFLEEKGLYILYVPDEATESAETTLKFIKNQIIDLGINKVDIAIMHGMFGFQLNNIVTTQTHNESDYLDMVNYYIHIGHIHTHNKYARIIAQGSFDRLAHGEEEEKGAILATVDKASNISSYEFIVNKTAKIFKTINIPKHYTIEEALDRLDKQILKYPEDSFIRIKAPKNHIVYQAFEELRKRYINYNLSKKNEEDMVTDNQLVEDITYTNPEYEVITITHDNIVDLITSEIRDTLICKNKLKDISQSILELV